MHHSQSPGSSTDSLVRVLGETVPFMQIKLQSQKFIEFLNVETQVSTEALVKALVHAQEQGDTRLQNAVKLYQYIAQSLTSTGTGGGDSKEGGGRYGSGRETSMHRATEVGIRPTFRVFLG